MTTEQARKEIVDDVLTNRDELRRALIEGLEKDVGDGFLDAVIEIVKEKKCWVVMDDKPDSEIGLWGFNLALATEFNSSDYATKYPEEHYFRIDKESYPGTYRVIFWFDN